MGTPRLRYVVLLVALGVLAVGCAGEEPAEAAPETTSGPATTIAPTTSTVEPPATTSAAAEEERLPGMPPVLNENNIYSETVAGKMSPAVADARHYVYVPTNDAGTVSVIDQETFEVLDVYQVGDLAQHVVPSWDMTVLYATANQGNVLVPFDPMTGEPSGEPFPIDAPYNLYFTPDGSTAVVMAERHNRIDFYHADTWEPIRSTDVPCRGPNHADWSIDGRFFVVTCEFSGHMLKMATTTGNVLDFLEMEEGARPQDVRLGPDGSTFYIADLGSDGVHLLDAASFEIVGKIRTGDGPHSVYPSRDTSRLYVANRHEATVSVIDPSVNEVVDTWVIPDGGSPDMGGVSADGSTLWLSGRHHDEVYAFDTETGELRARIPIPGGPHGLAVFPQPGRYSMGHTGNYR